ncbi:MAG: hypothetical protein H0X43_14110 [Nitrosospira sp.]|nr:hypothetical protein [Nitrosospira sp.]
MKTESPLKFFGIAGGIFLLGLAGAMLFASLDLIYVSDISRFGVWISLIYLGLLSIIYWRKRSHEKKLGSDKP